MDWSNVLISAVLTLLSALAGGAITWRVAKRHYVLAGDELRDESRRLRKELELIPTALYDARLTEVARDEPGGESPSEG